MDLSLLISSFFAGLLTFLAPCTLPLVPGYLGFISGASLEELQDQDKAKRVRWKIFYNGILYVIGFSAVFILMGIIFGIGGLALAQHRVWLSRIGGIFVIVFGLYMMGMLRFKWLSFMSQEKRFSVGRYLKPGQPTSSLIFGSAFAFGWTPCVGPILGSILLLASTVETIWQGAVLLTVFSVGLAIPFLVVAATIGSATRFIRKIGKYLKVVSFVGGILLVFLGVLLITNNFGAWLAFFYKIFSFINYEAILDYL